MSGPGGGGGGGGSGETGMGFGGVAGFGGSGSGGIGGGSGGNVGEGLFGTADSPSGLFGAGGMTGLSAEATGLAQEGGWGDLGEGLGDLASGFGEAVAGMFGMGNQSAAQQGMGVISGQIPGLAGQVAGLIGNTISNAGQNANATAAANAAALGNLAAAEGVGLAGVIGSDTGDPFGGGANMGFSSGQGGFDGGIPGPDEATAGRNIPGLAFPPDTQPAQIQQGLAGLAPQQLNFDALIPTLRLGGRTLADILLERGGLNG